MMRHLKAYIYLILLVPGTVRAEERFPPPEFRSGHTLPETFLPAARGAAWNYLDVAALTVALGLAAYFVLRRRSRWGVFAVMAASLAYFGFWRKGCVCPIGAIQNVAYAIWNPEYALPWVVALFFLLPLFFTLFFGRVFCSGVCPLGAIQDAVLWKPIHLPSWLEAALGLLAYAYLGLAVLLAATGSDFVICAYDPFVGFFRLSGTAHMLFLGAALLAMGMFVGRIYCRFLCPYSVLLRLLAPIAKWRVSITPRDCINCRLCEESCPFGAIRLPSSPDAPPVSPPDRLRIVGALVLVVVLPFALAWLGHRAGPRIALMDSTVRLALAQQRATAGDRDPLMADSLEALAQSGEPPEVLYQQAATVQRRFITGGAWLGAWMGLVIALKLVGLARRRPEAIYAADAAGCLACARCYQHCPVESTPAAEGSAAAR